MISSKECKKILEDNNIRMSEIKHLFVLSSRKTDLELKFTSFNEVKKFVNFNLLFINEFNSIQTEKVNISKQDNYLAQNNQRRFVFGNHMSITFLPDHMHIILKIYDNLELVFSGESKLYNFVQLNYQQILNIRKAEIDLNIEKLLQDKIAFTRSSTAYDNDGDNIGDEIKKLVKDKPTFAKTSIDYSTDK